MIVAKWASKMVILNASPQYALCAYNVFLATDYDIQYHQQAVSFYTL